MALTMPFINTLPAFDANIGLQTNIFVLGGDAITAYQFLIYDQSEPDTVLYSSAKYPVTNDIANKTIRSFPIQLTPSMGINQLHLTNCNLMDKWVILLCFCAIKRLLFYCNI